MKSTLERKPADLYPDYKKFIEDLQKAGFTLKYSDESFRNWTQLEAPLSSDFPNPSSKDFTYQSKKNSLSSAWGLVFRDIQFCKDPAANEIAIDFPDAAIDFLLAKMIPTEWVGDKENFLSQHSVRAESGVVVGPHCQISSGVILEAGVRIGARVKIGKDTRIGAGSRIADDTVIGENCYFRGPVSLGGQGFGFIRYPKSPLPKHRVHVGSVLIGDGVKLGSFVAIDRGVFEDTVIGNFTATDNVVQIGHNCKLGTYNILCGFVALAGSTIMGDFVTLGGMVASKGHLKVGNKVQVGGFSGIGSDVADGSLLRGVPARPIRRDLKIMAIQDKLPELYAQLKPLLKGIE